MLEHINKFKWSSDDIKAHSQKIQTIYIFTSVNKQNHVAKIFGLLNYLGKFIPNLSIESANLRKLLEKDNEFIFDAPLWLILLIDQKN